MKDRYFAEISPTVFGHYRLRVWKGKMLFYEEVFHQRNAAAEWARHLTK